LWTYYGLAKLGAVSVPMNTAAKGDLLRYQVDHADAVMMVVDAEYLPAWAETAPRCPKVAHTVVNGTPGEHRLAHPVSDFEAVLQADRAPPEAEVSFT